MSPERLEELYLKSGTQFGIVQDPQFILYFQMLSIDIGKHITSIELHNVLNNHPYMSLKMKLALNDKLWNNDWILDSLTRFAELINKELYDQNFKDKMRGYIGE